MLDAQVVNELARQIVVQQFAEAWRYWLILLALVFLFSAAGAWLAAYFKIRGENFAKKADFKELLDELQKQTEVTVEIKAIVGHATWLTQEWNKTRRLKLEEYLEEVTAIDHRLDAKNHDYLYGDVLVNPTASATAKADMLQALYFPELFAEHRALAVAVNARLGAAIGVRQSRLARVVPGRGLGSVAVNSDEVDAYNTTYPPLLEAVSGFKAKCGDLIKTLANPAANAAED